MVRSLLTPETTDLHISIPQTYVGKKVEVLVFTYDETVDAIPVQSTKMEQFWGIISEETTESMHRHINSSRQEWEKDI